MGKQKSTFWPQSKATSTSTLSPRGHLSCRHRLTLKWKHQHSVRWTQRSGFSYLLWYNSWERFYAISVLIHTHTLDFNQPKTKFLLHIKVPCPICFGFFFFLIIFIFSPLVLSLYCYHCCIIYGTWWIYNLHWAVLLFFLILI